jgi:hypothetical protein
MILVATDDEAFLKCVYNNRLNIYMSTVKQIAATLSAHKDTHKPADRHKSCLHGRLILFNFLNFQACMHEFFLY